MAQDLAAHPHQARLVAFSCAFTRRTNVMEFLIARIAATQRADLYLAGNDVEIFRYPPSRDHRAAYTTNVRGLHGVAPALKTASRFKISLTLAFE